MRGARPIIAVMLAALTVSPAPAEVLKSMADCEPNRLCASYRIVMTPPDGWVIDAAASQERGVQMLVPKGDTFDTAAALIYVQTFYKPDKALSLAAFADNSNTRWKARLPSARISARSGVARANGKPAFLVFAYDNPGKTGQTHEIGTFAPDSDRDGNTFVVNAVLSGDKAAVERAEPTFVAWLKGL